MPASCVSSGLVPQKRKFGLSKILSNFFVRAALVGLLSISLAGTVLAEETRLVSVGEHELEVIVQGKGEQTIVFESGLGYDYAVWREVAEILSQSAKVVSYSRAGNGSPTKVICLARWNRWLQN